MNNKSYRILTISVAVLIIGVILGLVFAKDHLLVPIWILTAVLFMSLYITHLFLLELETINENLKKVINKVDEVTELLENNTK